MILRMLIIIFSVVVLSGCGKRNKVVVDHNDGYKGVAALNPYLAAQMMLTETHYDEVKVRNGFIKYDYETGMVVSPASAISTNLMVDKMLDWVSDGGVYVCILQRGDKYWIDVGQRAQHDTSSWDYDWMVSEESKAAKNYLLEQMNIKLLDDPSGKTTGGTNYRQNPKHPVALGEELPLVEDVKVQVRDDFGDLKEYELQLGGTKVMEYGGYLSSSEAHQQGEYHRFLGLEYGAGKIYFVTDGRLFRNPYLGMNDHAALLEHISADANGEIIFGYGNRRGFWSLMINYAGPALLGVFFLLVFWLWKSIPRFGPLLEIKDGQARDYAQAVSNTGRFLWKYKGADALLTAMRDNLFRTSGMFNEEGQSDEMLIETFAEKSGLEVEAVIEALTRKDINDAGDMVRITQNLQTILNAL